MRVLRQTFQPEIKCFHFNDDKFYEDDSTLDLYHVFSAINNQTSGKGLQNYTFSRSVNNFVGTFSFSIKEDVTDHDLFMDKVQLFDIIEIFEHNEKVFVGFVRNVSFSAIAGTSQKLLTISGQSVEGLFDLYKINFDYTAMNFVEALPYNVEFWSELNRKGKDGSLKPLSIKDCVQKIIAFFMDISFKFNSVSSVYVGKMLQYFYDIAFSSGEVTKVGKKEFTFIPKAEIENLNVEGTVTDFLYPISLPLVSNNEVRSFDLIRNLLPDQVYEIYGSIKNQKPFITIREKPFSKSAWNNLGTAKEISADIITDYSFTLSNENVYTAFIPYVENSDLSPQLSFFDTAGAKGYSIASQSDKTKLYGYQPLQVNFIGFTTSESETKSNKTENDSLKNEMGKLSEKLCEWYGNLDEMYSGNVTVVNYSDETINLPEIGTKAKLCGCEFYVSEETHNWSFGSAPTIAYKLDRGGNYASGSFVKASGLSRQFAEILK